MPTFYSNIGRFFFVFLFYFYSQSERRETLWPTCFLNFEVLGTLQVDISDFIFVKQKLSVHAAMRRNTWPTFFIIERKFWTFLKLQWINLIKYLNRLDVVLVWKRYKKNTRQFMCSRNALEASELASCLSWLSKEFIYKIRITNENWLVNSGSFWIQGYAENLWPFLIDKELDVALNGQNLLI